ncbi:MAG: biotin transporter BioY [Archaeoglobaceae archaeon]|nr:biotin transporter BioY [Archaeoglobaceae archaeon]MDW8118690.1 biotin transporter BioY [Archaeoglobaceae archaeon]
MDFVRYRFFRWRYEAEFEQKILLALAFAAFTGLCAQIRLYLPWTPVPITMQTFAVFLSALVLGKHWGGISQVLYVSLGFAGIPWFAGFKGGIAILSGPTLGYLFGFIIAAFLVGHLVDRYIGARYFLTLLPILMFANFVIIYGLGLLWLSWMFPNTGFFELLMMGAIPFIPGDLTKILMVSAVGKMMMPKVAFNGEVDAGKRYRLF